MCHNETGINLSQSSGRSAYREIEINSHLSICYQIYIVEAMGQAKRGILESVLLA